MAWSGTAGALLRGVRGRVASLRGRRPLQWTHGDIVVHYRGHLDGGGTFAAGAFVRALAPERGRFERGFEWCCGPAFIGFALLAEGICQRLCLADVNPDAIAQVRRTVSHNHLGDRVTSYLSDNLSRVPPTEKFDLVVGNPPSYCGLNPRHPLYGRFKDDLRPNDLDWHIHRGFFRQIRAHLNPGARIYLMEVAVRATEVRTPGFAEPYDIRPRPPLDDFQQMIDDAGLTLERVEPLLTAPGGFPVDLLVIAND
jgi:hypothetical protein